MPVAPADTALVYRGILSPDLCDRIIAANRPHVAAHRHRSGGTVHVHGIDGPEHMCGAEDIVFKLFHRAVWVTGWDIPMDIARFGCSLYLPGDSMGEHVDDEEREEPPWDLLHRGISFSLPLSDPADYTGGDLRVRTSAGAWTVPDIRRGDAVAFGSSTPHEVTPVTAGERWVLLAWGYCNHNQRDIR